MRLAYGKGYTLVYTKLHMDETSRVTYMGLRGTTGILCEM